MRHIHLDPLGGAAGDMFVAALLDAFPEHAGSAAQAAARLSGAACRLLPHDDGTLTGRRFVVDVLPEAEPPHGHADHLHGHPAREPDGHGHSHDHARDHDHAHAGEHDHAHASGGHGHHHGPGGRNISGDAPDAPLRPRAGPVSHVGCHDDAATSVPGQADAPRSGSWQALRGRIASSDLPDAVRDQALGIFGCLAEAEGRVHGMPADAVTFHEVGAADSVADIVAAAWLIAVVGPAAWSVGALPLGAGTVRTAHGPMPVPAPATALLLEGFAVRDDGVGGERVTPTGAAILRHLGCAGAARPRTATLRGSGTGFGSRVLPGMSNCLRALVLDTPEAQGAEPAPGHGAQAAGAQAAGAQAADAQAAVAPGPVAAGQAASGHRALAVIAFEVDDQSGEALAAGLDLVRGTEGVHDVVQMAAFGKKNRMAVHVQVLVRPDRLEAAVDACFRETTTIGLRTHLVQGRALPRRFAEVAVDGRPVVVKLVERPGGVTAKAESDSVRQVAGHAARTSLRREAERRAEEG